MNAYFCVEDQLSRAVIVRLLSDLLGTVNLIELLPSQGGFGSMKKKFGNYCTLAEHHHVFILTDLDSAECPPSLRKDWISNAKLCEPLPSKMNFNIAVTEVEAWLIADRNNLSDFLGIPQNALRHDIVHSDPKKSLLDCVQKYGNREAKSQLLPIGAARVGLGYNTYLSSFATGLWSFTDAAESNTSLQRAVTRIRSVADET